MLKYCNHCKVVVRGSDEICPLCRNPMPMSEGEGLDLLTLIEEEELARDVFPYVKPNNVQHLAFRILTFVSIAAIVIILLLKWLLVSAVAWPWFAIIGIVSMWLVVVTILRKKRNISKTIVWQVLILSLAALVLDRTGGFQGWSLNYAIPIILICAQLTMTTLALIFSLKPRDFVMYVILGALMGLVPLIFIWAGWVRTILPSALSAGASALFLAAVLLFQGKVVFHELQKRFHV